MGLLESAEAKQELHQADGRIRSRAETEKFQEAGMEMDMLLSQVE